MNYKNKFAFSHCYAKEHTNIWSEQDLKLVNNFIIIDINSKNHLCTFIKYLLGRGNASKSLN